MPSVSSLGVQYTLKAEFVTGSYTNITNDLIRFNCARQVARLGDGMSIGEASITLHNTNKLYSPANSASAYSSGMAPGTNIKMQAVSYGYMFADDLVATGNCAVEGNQAYKNGGVGAWDSSVYSKQGLAGGCFVSFVVAQTDKEILVGINTDPTTDSFFNSIDYAIYTESTGALTISISPAGTPSFYFYGTYSVGDVLSVAYDGVNVKFYKNGTLLHTEPAAANLTLFLDSSFYDLSSRIKNLQFGQLDNYDSAGLSAGKTHYIYTGKIANININPLIGSQVVNIDCTDIAEKINRTEIKLPMTINTNPTSLFSSVMSQCGVSSHQLHDAMTEVIPYVGWSGISGGTAINKLIDFGAYYVNVDGSGIVNVRKNYFDIDGVVVSSHDEFFGLTYDTNGKQIINRASVRSTPKKLDTIVNTIGYLLGPLLIKRSSGLNFFVDYINPYSIYEKTPASSVSLPSSNFVVTTNSDGGGVNITSQCSIYKTFFGSTAICSLYNGSSYDAYVTALNIVGYSIYDSPTLTSVTNNTSSQSRYGKFEAEITTDLIGSLVYAKDYSNFLVTNYLEPTANISISLNNDYPHVLSLELGDLIHVAENNTAINDRFKVLSVDHDIDCISGVRHVATYKLEKYIDRTLLILSGSPTTGKLDERYLSF